MSTCFSDQIVITFNPDERMESMTGPALFGQMTALADPTRSRLLLALERNELTVNELRSILQLPQSTISRHIELFGRRADVALLGLFDESWTIADLGCGTGPVTQSLAPFVNRVIAVDESSAMLSAARKRLHEVDNVDIRNGRLEALPLADGEV